MSLLITCYLCDKVCRWEDGFDHEESGEDICGSCYDLEWEKRAK